MADQTPSEFPCVHVPSRTRLSTSNSISTSDPVLKHKEHTTELEVDMDSDTLARAISNFWQVPDPELVLNEFGVQRIAAVHRKMLWMSRRQKLSHVRNIAKYFMAAVVGRRKPPSHADESGHADAQYEAYLVKQRARGQDV